MRKYRRLLIFLCSLVSVFYFLHEAFENAIHAELPINDAPIVFYSNDLRSDLRLTMVSAIQRARESVVLIVYSLSDLAVLDALNEQAEAGISVYLVLDHQASSAVFSKLSPKIQYVKRRGPGLMHYKVLVIDDASVFLGSANMTSRSLRMHGNLVVGLFDKALAQYFVSKAHQMTDRLETARMDAKSFQLGTQKVDISLLPDDRLGVEKILKLIHSAKKTIRVAMYTWTRKDFAEALGMAAKRGVNVRVVLDRSASYGSSKLAYTRLTQLGIPVRLSQGEPLLHYKMMIIDDQILVNGSANWTGAAFQKNDDYFMILHGLSANQSQQLRELWQVIEFESYIKG